MPRKPRSISRTPICSPLRRNSIKHVVSSNWPITTSIAASCSLRSAGTIARVEVKSFAQVAAGQPIVTLYSDDRFETSFLVPAATFQSLKLGQQVDIKVADLPGSVAQRRNQ